MMEFDLNFSTSPRRFKSLRRFVYTILLLQAGMMGYAFSQNLGVSATPDRLRYYAKMQVKEKIGDLLGRYCTESCQLMDVEVRLEENFEDDINLGFEGLKPGDSSVFAVSDILAHIQIDNRVTSLNKDRMQKILQNYLSTL